MKKKFNPIWYLVIGICILVIPSAIYLGFLIPAMKEEYIILMSSAGIIGGSAAYGASLIPEKAKFGTLFKTATKAYTTLVMITLVQEFLPQILGLIAVFISSYIIFEIMRALYKDGRRKQENAELSAEITKAITPNTK